MSATADRGNGSARIWMAIIVLAGGGVTAKGVNDYRLRLENRLTRLESAGAAQAADIEGLQSWQRTWEREGALPVDGEQNRRLKELESTIEVLGRSYDVGTRFTGEEGLLNTGCDDRQNKALLLILREMGLESSQEVIYGDVKECEGLIKRLEETLKKRRKAGL